VTAADLAGVYKEVAETVGVDNAYKLYRHFRGLQMLFPLKFYSNEYIARQVCTEYDGKNVRDIARKYGYSESRVRQILRDGRNEQKKSTAL
jgi:Mor family transcriptional regulator